MPASQALKGKLILLYFSAHWYAPCKAFTPKLAAFVEAARAAGHQLEVVFVSSDRSQAEFSSYFQQAHGDWLAVEFDSPARKQLGEEHNVQGIPSMLYLSYFHHFECWRALILFAFQLCC